MIYIGIDPGVNTGLACWDSEVKEFFRIETMRLHSVLRFLHFAKHGGFVNMHVCFEDARQRKWFGSKNATQDRNRLQGAGSVKRDCQILEDALTDWQIKFTAVAPKNNNTKTTAEYFQRITGWEGRTNEHSRDAAMLVFQR